MLRLENSDHVKQIGDLFHPDDAHSSERRVINLITSDHSSCMRKAGLSRLQKSSWFHSDDGLVTGKTFHCTDKFLCIPDAFFYVEDDASGIGIAAEKIDEIS